MTQSPIRDGRTPVSRTPTGSSWDDLTRGSLPTRLRTYLDGFVSTPRTREVLLETWQAFGHRECPAFGEYALSPHNSILAGPGRCRNATTDPGPAVDRAGLRLDVVRGKAPGCVVSVARRRRVGMAEPSSRNPSS